MKKLFQINTVVNSGSTGRIAEDIGILAMNSGWESYIAYGRDRNTTSQSKKIRIGNDMDMKIHGALTRVFDKHSLGFSSRNATKELVKKIDEVSPDVIHLHNLHGYYLNVEVLFNYLSKKDIPLIWTLHDCWSFTGHCAFFERVGCEKWKTECHNCPQQREYPASYVFDRSRNNFIDKKRLFNSVSNLTLVPVSNWLAGLLKDSFLQNHKVKMIHNGIDTDVFTPHENSSLRRKYNIENKFIVLGVASEWSDRKGLGDFIKLSETLDGNERIVLIGLSKKQVNFLPKNIIGIERTENTDELASWYTEAGVFVNPTYSDNFPTTNLEALACGTPIITYQTGGSSEAIDENTGFVVKKGEIKDLVSAIKKIKEKGKQHYALACSTRAKDFFKKEERFQEYIELYDSLL